MNFTKTVFRTVNTIIFKNHPYSKSKLLSIYIGMRLRQIVAKLFRKTVLTQRLYGYQMHFYHFPTFISLFEEIFVDEVYSTQNTRRTIIDCGANVGVSVLYFLVTQPGCHVVAFEPDAQAFLALQKSFGTESRVELVNKAVGKTDEQRTFYSDDKHGGMPMSSLRKERLSKGSASQTVECVRLSPYLTKEVDFLKMDIEGGELEVFGEIDGKIDHVKEMSIEYHHHLSPEEDRLSEILSVLEKNNFGYQLTFFGSGSTKPPTYQDIHFYAYKK